MGRDRRVASTHSHWGVQIWYQGLMINGAPVDNAKRESQDSAPTAERERDPSMTVAQILENARSAVARRLDRRIETLDVVYDDDLWGILDSHGLLNELDAGHLVCYKTGVPLTRDNVGGMIGTPGGPKLIADTVLDG